MKRKNRKGLRRIGSKLRPHAYPRSGHLVNEGQLRQQYRQALTDLMSRVGPGGIGDYVEFGVYRGTSMSIMYQELLRAGLDDVRLFGFDSFAGLPPDREGHWRAGQFAASYQEAVATLDAIEVDWDRVTLVEGFYSESLTEELASRLDLRKVGLIMVDCDLYASARQALDFCGPRIADEAVVFFDDWNPLARRDMGEKRAFDEFLRDNPDFAAVPVDEYDYLPGDRHGKVFRLSRRRDPCASAPLVPGPA